MALLFFSCSQNSNHEAIKNQLQESDFSVSNVKTYPEEAAKILKTEQTEKNGDIQSNGLIETVMLPKFLEAAEQVNSITFHNGVITLYDANGEVIQESNYEVVSEDNQSVIINIKGREYTIEKQAPDKWVFKAGYADYVLNR